MFFSGCDDIIKNTNSDAIPIDGDVNISNEKGDIPFKDKSGYVPIIPPKKDTDTQKCTLNISQNELIGSNYTLNDSTNLSKSLLRNSEDMLQLSQSLQQSGIFTQNTYVKAMLELSEDIAEMAVKVGEMSDRILTMSDKIGTMSDRIIKTQKIQNANVVLTQKNIIQAQKNLNKILEK
jgi:hypothetical protein